MSDENIFEEIAETDRKLWEEGGGTMHGFLELCHRIAQEDHAKFLAEMEREKAAGTWTPEADAVPDCADAMCVREGDAPGYGAGKTSDLARKGVEGDAE